MKAKRVRSERPVNGPLAGKTLAMIFDRPSTRTRVSFDVAMRELGGDTIMLTGAEMQLGRGESIADTARVLSRYVDAIMIRILDHRDLDELARYATVPVINGLTKRSHPCQVMADLHHVRRASRPDPRPQDRLERRLQQRAVVLDRRWRNASTSSSTSPAPRSCSRRPNASRPARAGGAAS